MAGFISAAIIVGSAVTAAVSYSNAKRQEKAAEAQMAQQRAMANEQVRLSQEQVRGQAVGSANRQERLARGAYGRSDQIGIGARTPDLLGGDMLGGGMMGSEEQRNRGTLLGM